MPPKTAKTAPKASAAKPDYAKRKFTPRAPLPAAERLPKLYRALTDQVHDGYFDNAKKTCKRILALDASSVSAFQTLLFLLLHTDDYAAALELVTSSAQPNLDFERAYCLYRLHREPEALAALPATKSQRDQHLRAQILYRLGDYTAAQDVYDSLLASASGGEADDIRTNLKATATQVSFVEDDYRGKLNAPAVENPASGLPAYTPNAGELETHVPTVPIGWARVAKSEAPAASKVEKKPRTKPRHRLPKGAELANQPKQDVGVIVSAYPSLTGGSRCASARATSPPARRRRNSPDSARRGPAGGTRRRGRRSSIFHCNDLQTFIHSLLPTCSTILLPILLPIYCTYRAPATRERRAPAEGWITSCWAAFLVNSLGTVTNWPSWLTTTRPELRLTSL